MKSPSFFATNLLLISAFTSAVVVQDVNELSRTTYDFIIVGGGTAGVVVANRLTENPKFTVLVIEAGPTNVGVLDSEVPFLSFSLAHTIYDWNYTTVPQRTLNNRVLDYARAHMLGGCSSHNGMVYTRGSSDDYDRWATITGDPGWSWNNLLPFIKKNERWSPPVDGHDVTGNFDPSVHGFDGPMSVSLPAAMPPLDQMILEVTKQLPDEFPYLLDQNAGRPIGLGWNPNSIGNGTRSSSAAAYLGPQFTARRNLDILLQTKVVRVLSRPNSPRLTFNAVELDQPLGKRLTATKEIVISAGAIGTPHLLLNSGIGDREVLTGRGIHPVLHLPDVGQNLTDQPLLNMVWTVSSNDTLDNLIFNSTLVNLSLAQWQKNHTGPLANTGTTMLALYRLPSNSPIFKKFRDPSAGPNTPHIELAPLGGSPFSPQLTSGHHISMLNAVLTPVSRGSITLNKINPLGPPVIDVAFFTSEFDFLVMREAIKVAQKFFEAPIWKGYTVQQILPPANATTDEQLDAFIREFSASTSHIAGTAAMSAKDASYGVVDPDLSVKNALGLRIVDASIMPFVTASHTQAPVYAIAEKGADLIKKSWS